jgi:hypothetical protein
MTTCPNCGFNIEDSFESVCPQCGFDFSDDLSCPYELNESCLFKKCNCHVGLGYEDCVTYLNESGINGTDL